MVNLSLKLAKVFLYVENQGDKFHPMSDELKEVLTAEGYSEDEITLEVYGVISTFEERFPTHVERVNTYLDTENIDEF